MTLKQLIGVLPCLLLVSLVFLGIFKLCKVRLPLFGKFNSEPRVYEKPLREKHPGLARRGFADALNAAKFGASIPTDIVGMIRDKFSIQKFAK